MGETTPDRAGVTWAQRPGHAVLRLVGEIDLAEVEPLRRAAAALVAAGRDVVVDLGDVTFVDVCGLDAVVQVRRRVHAAGLECHLVAPSPAVRRLAGLTRSEAALGWEAPARGRTVRRGLRRRPGCGYEHRPPSTSRH